MNRFLLASSIIFCSYGISASLCYGLGRQPYEEETIGTVFLLLVGVVGTVLLAGSILSFRLLSLDCGRTDFRFRRQWLPGIVFLVGVGGSLLGLILFEEAFLPALGRTTSYSTATLVSKLLRPLVFYGSWVFVLRGAAAFLKLGDSSAQLWRMAALWSLLPALLGTPLQGFLAEAPSLINLWLAGKTTIYSQEPLYIASRSLGGITVIYLWLLFFQSSMVGFFCSTAFQAEPSVGRSQTSPSSA